MQRLPRERRNFCRSDVAPGKRCAAEAASAGHPVSERVHWGSKSRLNTAANSWTNLLFFKDEVLFTVCRQRVAHAAVLGISVLASSQSGVSKAWQVLKDWLVWLDWFVWLDWLVWLSSSFLNFDDD